MPSLQKRLFVGTRYIASGILISIFREVFSKFTPQNKRRLIESPLNNLLTKSYGLSTVLFPVLVRLEINFEYHLSQPNFVTIFDRIRTMRHQARTIQECAVAAAAVG